MKGCGKMFETGEYVVYGRTGICKVTGVTTMTVSYTHLDVYKRQSVHTTVNFIGLSL